MPHLVVRVDDIESVDVRAGDGSFGRTHGLGPVGANVNFVSPPRESGQPVADPDLRARRGGRDPGVRDRNGGGGAGPGRAGERRSCR